jgi:hypothetical protein
MRNRMKDFWKLAAILAVLMSALPFTAYGADGQKSPPAKKAPSAKAAKPVSPASTGTPCPNPPPCGSNCTSTPLQPTDCWTTEYGPAKADVIIPKAGTKTAVTSPNMLYCEGNTYALCFFSGPPTKTGKSQTNKDLPCVLSADGKTASCTCQAYTSGPNFVDINGILNQGAYFEAVSQCGLDGGRCKNIEHCWPQDDPKKQTECAKYPQANVCQYVKNQGGADGSTDPKSWLWPKADLISTFSFAMSGKDGGYHLGGTSCAAGLYAGCMTAPCTYGPNHTSPTQKGELVTCQCPTYNGPYQIGQNGQSCSITSDNASKYVWSASYTVPVDAHVVKKH